jgi:hypothetical protein
VRSGRTRCDWPLSQWVRDFCAITSADDAHAINEDINKEAKMLAESERFRTLSKKCMVMLKFFLGP